MGCHTNYAAGFCQAKIGNDECRLFRPGAPTQLNSGHTCNVQHSAKWALTRPPQHKNGEHRGSLVILIRLIFGTARNSDQPPSIVPRKWQLVREEAVSCYCRYCRRRNSAHSQLWAFCGAALFPFADIRRGRMGQNPNRPCFAFRWHLKGAGHCQLARATDRSMWQSLAEPLTILGIMRPCNRCNSHIAGLAQSILLPLVLRLIRRLG
jgi:hypothetical protein